MSNKENLLPQQNVPPKDKLESLQPCIERRHASISSETTRNRLMKPPVHCPLSAAYMPQLVLDYLPGIFDHLSNGQERYRAPSSYMSQQSDINGKMRAIMVDWLVDVCLKYRLLPQTLFATVNLIDRFLALCSVGRQRLQLVGITCLMIITKYEEIYPPLLKDFIAVCDNAYSKDEILDMEAQVLKALGFNLNHPSSLTFLELVQIKVQLDPAQFMLARYILENALVDLSHLEHSNLELAAGAVFLVSKIFKRRDWKLTFDSSTGVDQLRAKESAKILHSIMEKVDASSLTALRRKFSTLEHFEVSKFKIEKVSPRPLN